MKASEALEFFQRGYNSSRPKDGAERALRDRGNALIDKYKSRAKEDPQKALEELDRELESLSARIKMQSEKSRAAAEAEDFNEMEYHDTYSGYMVREKALVESIRELLEYTEKVT